MVFLFLKEYSNFGMENLASKNRLFVLASFSILHTMVGVGNTEDQWISGGGKGGLTSCLAEPFVNRLFYSITVYIYFFLVC